MSHIRSFWRNRRLVASGRSQRVRHAARNSPAGLAGIAGEASSLAAAQIEALEGRVLLAVDHPSFNQVFGPANLDPTVIDVSSGQGEAIGRINSNNDDDMFQFTTLADDFVTIQIDTLNDTVSSLDSMVRIFSTGGSELFTGNGNDLSPTRVTDGWVGFFAPAGTYYVQVRSNLATGTKAVGNYTVRADVTSTVVDASTGTGDATGAIVRPTDDDVFRLDVGAQDFISLLADTLATDFGGTETNLNTKLAVYNSDGEQIAVASGNGTLTGSVTVTPTDGWVGFLADAGTYYLRVLSDRANASFGTGAFTLFADVETSEITLDTSTGQVTGGTGDGSLTRLGEDQVFRVDIPDAAGFDSLVTIVGFADALDLDTHLDIYDAVGNPVTSDSTSGNSTNAFALVKGGRGVTLFVRIRSDEIGDPAFRASTGGFSLVLDAAATSTPLDPVTRVFSGTQVLDGVAFPGLYVFTTLSSGTTVMAAFNSQPFPDPAMTLLSADGQVIEFNDDTFGLSPQIDAELVGGLKYFILVDGFDSPSAGPFRLNIENLTAVPDPGTGFPLDDHANRGDWTHATPIQFVNPAVLQPGQLGAFGNGLLPVGYHPPGVEPMNDHSQVVLGYSRGRVFGNGDSDVFQITPQIDMWGQFAGHVQLNPATGEPFIPARWEPGILPAMRLQVLIRGNIDGTLTPTLNVFRSNVLRADPNAGPIATSNTVLQAAPFTQWEQAGWLAGFLDPAAFPPELSFVLGDPIQYTNGVPTLGDANTIAAWGGEPLFLEVTGIGTGTYEVLVVADAMPNESDPNNSILRDEQISLINELYGREPGEADFNSGFVGELLFSTSFAGDSATAFGDNGLFDLSGHVERLFFYGSANAIPGPPALSANSANIYGPATPSATIPPYGGATVLRETGLAGIERIDDKDTYSFRATATGTTEIRINTTNLTNTFMERIANGLERTTDPQTGLPEDDAEYDEFSEIPDGRDVYDSLLDASVRIYNADFEQIAFNDDNSAIRGDSQTQSFGSLGNFIFQRRDPAVTFNVDEGEVYYVIVESAQRYEDATPQNVDDRVYATSDGTATGLLTNQYVDWRYATGSYQMLVNSMPKSSLGPPGPTQLAQGDDHIDFLDPLTNGIPAFSAVAEQATVLFIQPDGSLDANTFTAGNGTQYAGAITNRGLTRDTDFFTFVASASGTMEITVARASGSTIIPAFNVLTDEGDSIAAATGSSAGSIIGTFTVTQGQRYFIGILGGGGSQGRYTLELQGQDPTDDHADIGQFQDATELDILDFLGGGNGLGDLEEPGDSDVFTFQAFTTQDVTVTIVPTSAVDPFVEIYEVQEDLNGHPILRRIAMATFDTEYTTTFSVSRDRVSTVSSSRLDQYFLVVRGAIATSESGTYRFEFEFSPTDDHADAEQLLDPETRSLASLLLADTVTGTGDRTGDVEFFYDSDLFVYIAPAGGPAIFSTQPTGDQTLQPKVSVYNSVGVLIASNDPLVTIPVDVQATVERGQAYYVVVQPSAFLFNPNGTPIDPTDPRLTGEYRLSVTGPAVDDHANLGEFDRATLVTLDTVTGNGAVGEANAGGPDNPLISPAIDTDLFRFSPRADGDTVVRVASLAGSLVRPSISVFREDAPGVFTQIAANSRNTPGAIQVTIADANDDANYYVLVQDIFNSRSGEYRLTIDGEPGGGVVTDPAAINFNQPDGDVVLAGRSGNGSTAASIDVIGDRDLFTFTALGSGPVFIQVITADGATLNASITVLNAPNELPGSVVGFDAGGLAGVSSSVTIGAPGSGLTINEGQQFWVIVDGIGTSVGGYRLRINGAPAVFDNQGDIDFRYRVVYPEGFANGNISEFVAIANPGDTDASYRIVLYYQDGTSRSVFGSGVNAGVRSLAAGTRGGAQLSQAGLGARGNVRTNVPYSIVVESDQPVVATVSHYDLGVTTGEAATRETSSAWYFPRVERNPGAVQDFITFFNPNSFDLRLTMTVYTEDGQQIVIERNGPGALPAQRRGGFAMDAFEQLPIGVFAVKIEAQPRDPSNNDDYVGFVAALTHYNQAETQGYGHVGDPSGGGLAGAVNSITRGNGVASEIAIFNPGASATTVSFVGSYLNSSLPDFARNIQVAAGSVVYLTAKQLGLTTNSTAGVRFTSASPVSVLSSQVQRGDADATLAATEVGTTAFFGDAFLTAGGAGNTYFESLSFYNPSDNDIDVTVRILFTNGESTIITVNIDANNFANLALDQSQALLSDPNRTSTFSIVTTSASPFAVSFSHYDLTFGGGWATSGAAYGLYNPISAIVG